MKNRQDLISYCGLLPPAFLPKNSGSLQASLKSWIGGRLTSSAKLNSLLLSSQSKELEYSVSSEARLFFDFHSDSKSVSWKQAYSFLKKGDHLMLPTPEIKNLKKIVLVSVNKTEQSATSKEFLQIQKKWFQFLEEVNQAMQLLGLERVATSSLVESPGTEPDLDFFSISPEARLFLSSSPEFQMKRLLCRGLTDIYEITKCFRKELEGPLHKSEFYMLEWYRAYSGMDVLIEDTYFLLNFLFKKRTGNSMPLFKKISMKKLFKEFVAMDLKPSSSVEDFTKELKKHQIPFDPSSPIEDLFYLLFLNQIEPQLEKNQPYILYDYPPFHRAYSRIGPEGWASRFELFWKGIELANAFDEVTDTKEQLNCFREDNMKRKAKGKSEVPLPQLFLEDMREGMPPSAGIALGLERLFMAFYSINDIRQICTY